MSRLTLSREGGYTVTPISDNFIEYYMPDAPPMFSLIYIFTYKRLYNGEKTIDTKELADIFKILESDVVNAWKHWENKGLVAVKIDADGPGSQNIIFNEPAKRQDENEPRTVQEKEVKSNKRKLKTPLDARIDYSVQELEYYQKQSEDIKNLFLFAEQTLGRTLKYSDLNLIYSLHDWLRFPIPVIEKLLSYCVENGNRNINYIEAVALDWNEKEIDSVSSAEDYIQSFNKDFKSILKAFGLNRNPAPKEIEYMEKWLKQFAIPLEIILEACDKTIISTSKPTLKYTDTILENWHKNGVKTLDDIKNYDMEYTQNKKEKSIKPAAKKNTRFINFQGRTINYEEIEKLEREYIEDIVNGPVQA